MNEFKKSKLGWPVLAVTAILAIFFAGIYPALAAPPDNDDIASATNHPRRTVLGYYRYIRGDGSAG